MGLPQDALEVGDVVTQLRGPELPVLALDPYAPIRYLEDRTLVGVPLEVLALSLPFAVVRPIAPSVPVSARLAIDLRQVELCRVTDDYASHFGHR